MILTLKKIFLFFPARALISVQFFIIVAALFEVVGIASIIPFMSVLINPEIIQKYAIIKKIYLISGASDVRSFQTYLGWSVFLLVMLGNLISFMSMWLLAFVGQSYGYRIAKVLYKAYLNKDYLFFTKNNTSQLSANIITESDRINFGLLQPLLLINARIVLVIVISALLIVVNPQIWLATALIITVVYFVIFRLIKRHLKENGLRITLAHRKRMLNLSEGFIGIKEVKIYGKESTYTQEFNAACNSLASLQSANIVFSQFPRYFLETIIFGIMVIVALYGLRGVSAELAIPILSAYGIAGLKLIPAIQVIFGSSATIRSNLNALDVIDYKVMKGMEKEAEKDISDGQDKGVMPFDHSIELSINNFRYSEKERTVIEHAHLCIPKYSIFGVVGISGSGKSTIIDILLGLIMADDVVLSVDGIKIDVSNVRNWQQRIGYVPQEVFISDKSFAENIAFGVPQDSIDMNQVKKAAAIAKIAPYIESLPDAYWSKVGERGQQVSGGQKQRLGIARALYREPDIIVFDEATNSLDVITENEIISEIQKLGESKTIIMVAHRLSTVSICSQICVIDGGHTRFKGTYRELLLKSDIFRDMVKSSGVTQQE